MSDVLEAIYRVIQGGDQDEVARLTEKALAGGIPALEILGKGMIPGVEAMGEKFRSGEFFLPEVLISARVMNRGVEVLTPHFPKEGVRKRGTVIIGTIEGDMHDIGKNLVRMMLECGGFQTVDLDVDVSSSSFVNAAIEHKGNIIAISALLTTTMLGIPKVIEALKQTGLRGNVKVLVGGAVVTAAYAKEIGADGFAEDCTSAINEAKRILGI